MERREEAKNTVQNVEKDELKADVNDTNSEHGVEVFLRIYDLSNGMAKALSQQMIGIQVDGVWHTSIEAYGREYFFHGGLVVQNAGTTMFNPCVERASLGYTNCSLEALDDFFRSCESSWNERTYDFFENNCNNFTNWMANFLVGKDIPRYILDLPKKVKGNEKFRQLFGLN